MNFSKEGLLVTFLHTKTIQFGERRLHIPLIARDSPICPVKAYISHRHLLGRHGRKDSAPAFVFVDHSSSPCWLTSSVFIHTFRQLAATAGDSDSAAYSGHSFRRGGASWAFQAGIPGELIQILGDWSSDAYKRYLEFNMNSKMQLSALFSQGLP